MGAEVGDVLFSFAEWREVQSEHIETVEQIFAKAAFHYLFFHVPCRCSDDPGIDLPAVNPANRSYFFFLEYTQQLDLQPQGEFTNFIEENGAGVRLFK